MSTSIGIKPSDVCSKDLKVEQNEDPYIILSFTRRWASLFAVRGRFPAADFFQN